jgi:thioredoxin-dependent peroxiredoxin
LRAQIFIFTYNFPGTTQACLFRDSYTPLTATGFSIFGLSTDSLKANTSFKEKQKLPYTLLCDPSASLISAIGMKKPPKSTIRGVFIVDKAGKVLAAEPGGPAATVEVVKKLMGSSDAPAPAAEKVDKAAEEVKAAEEPKVEETKPATNGVNGTVANEDVAKANVAADVADTAQKLDNNEAPPA